MVGMPRPAAFSGAGSPSEDSVAVDPVAVDPVAVEPVAVEPAAVDAVAVDPVEVDPVAVDPAAVGTGTVGSGRDAAEMTGMGTVRSAVGSGPSPTGRVGTASSPGGVG